MIEGQSPDQSPDHKRIVIMKNHYLKHIWIDYRAELEFGVMVTAVLMLSYWATGVVIPAELTEHWLWPLLNACIATLCFFGAWLCLKHNDDNRIRIAWAVALLLWGLLEDRTISCGGEVCCNCYPCL